MTKTEKGKIVSVQDIKKHIHKCEYELRNMKTKNKLVDQYKSKMTYMLMHLRLHPCKKSLLDNWSMPDYSDIVALEKMKHGK